MAGSNAGNSDTMGLEVVLQSNPFASAANEDEKAEQFPKLGYEKVTATNQDGAEVKEAVAIAIGSPMFVDGTSEANRQVSELGMRVRESGHEVYSEIMEGVAAPMKPPMAKVTWHDASDEENDEEEEEEVDGEEDYSGSDDDYSEEHVVDGDEMQGGGLHREEDVELEWDKEERQEGREEKEKEKEDMEYPALTATRTRREVEDEDRAIKGGGQRARVKMPPEAMAVSLVSVREPEEGASMVSGEYPKLAISEKEWKYDDEYVPERDGRKKRKEGKKKRQIEQDDLRSCASYPSISVSEKGWQDGDDDEYHPGPRASRRGSGDEEEVMVESSDEAEVEFEAEVDEEEVYEYEEGSEEDEDGGHGGEEGVEYEEVEEIEDDEEMGYDGSDAEVEYVEVLEDDEHLALRNGDQGGQESDRAKSRGLTVQMETAMELHKTTDKDSLNPRVLHSDELDEIQEEGEEEEEDGDGDGDADLEDVHIGGGLMPRAAASADQEGVEGRDPAPWEVAGLYQRATSLEHQQLAEVRAALLESQARAKGLEAALAQARVQAAAQEAMTIQLSEQLHAMRRCLIGSEERARLAQAALISGKALAGHWGSTPGKGEIVSGEGTMPGLEPAQEKGLREEGNASQNSEENQAGAPSAKLDRRTDGVQSGRLGPGSGEPRRSPQVEEFSILEEQVLKQAEELHQLKHRLAGVEERAHVAESALAAARGVLPGSFPGPMASPPSPNTLELFKEPESKSVLATLMPKSEDTIVWPDWENATAGPESKPVKVEPEAEDAAVETKSDDTAEAPKSNPAKIGPELKPAEDGPTSKYTEVGAEPKDSAVGSTSEAPEVGQGFKPSEIVPESKPAETGLGNKPTENVETESKQAVGELESRQADVELEDKPVKVELQTRQADVELEDKPVKVEPEFMHGEIGLGTRHAEVRPKSSMIVHCMFDDWSLVAANLEQEVLRLREELAVQAEVARERATVAATAQRELEEAKTALEAFRLLLLTQQAAKEKLESQLRDTQGQVTEPGWSLSFGGAGAGPVPNGDAGQGGPEKPSRKGVMRSGKGVGKQGEEEESLRRQSNCWGWSF